MTFKKVLTLLKPYKSKVAVIVVLSVIIAVITSVTPFVSQRMIDDGIMPLDMQTVIFCVLILIVLCIGTKCIEYLQRKVEITISNSMSKDLRMKAFEHGFKLKPLYYKEHGFYKTISNALFNIGI